MATDHDETSRMFAEEILGPILLRYIWQLDLTIQHFASEKQAKILFASRAGIRIRALYDCFLASSNRTQPQNVDFFWISRFLCTKGIWNKDFQSASAVIEREFRFGTLRDIVCSIFKSTSMPLSISIDSPSLDRPGSEFSKFIWGESTAAHYLRWHLAEQSNLFEIYMAELLKNHQTVLIVDSGWQGTVQTLLSDWRPSINWWGAYFGKMGNENTDRRYWDKMLGLVFEADVFSPSNPITSLTLHHHLIEALFEPCAPSIEHLLQENNKVVAPGAESILKAVDAGGSDPLFYGVHQYIHKSATQEISQVLQRAGDAERRLACMIVFPNQDDIKLVGAALRSADFGRNLNVPVLNPRKDRYSGDSPESRVKDALWPSGQATLEYEDEIAIPLQQHLCGHKTTRDNLSTKKETHYLKDDYGLVDTPLVAIITRTMNRPMFLRRAICSVVEQSFENYIHVIVCDGGDFLAVKKIVDESAADFRKLLLIDNRINRGMEASSNIGIEYSSSKYIVIHDDDDTWEPTFLEEAIGFLEKDGGKKYGGVICHSWYVSEKIDVAGIRVLGRKPYHDWVLNVQLMEMAQENFFAPISFVFSREVYKKIDGFDERFPVLGDWDFNLRFLSECDIGVVPIKLANYHHRDQNGAVLFTNSLVGEISKHAEYNAVMRNKFLRSSPSNGNPNVGLLVSLGMSLSDMRNTTRRTLFAAESLRALQSENSEYSVVSRQEYAHLQTIADERWVGICALSQMLAEQQDIVHRDIRAEAIHGRAAVSNSLAEIEAKAQEQLADDRWVALNMLVVQIREPSQMDGTELQRLIEEKVENVWNFKVPAPPDFDEEAYLIDWPDVAEAIARGELGSAFAHYIGQGRSEGRRRPTKRIEAR